VPSSTRRGSSIAAGAMVLLWPLARNPDRPPDVVVRALDALVRDEERLSPAQRAWLAEIPVWTMVEALDDDPGLKPYRWVGPGVEELLRRLEELGGTAWVGRYLRLVVLTLVAKSATRPPLIAIPPSVAAIVDIELRSIVETDPEDGELFDVAQDRFWKDLALCRGTLVPLGMTVVEPCWLPREVFAANAAASPPFPDWDRALRGRWLEWHAFQRRRVEFSSANRVRMFGLLADLLEANPVFEGVWGASWYYDPAVAEVSPHLAYLREQPRAGGAWLFPLTSTPATVEMALATSRTRRRRHEEGSYVPSRYGLVWPRAEFIGWVHELGSSAGHGA
jgi:hypothetical protein